MSAHLLQEAADTALPYQVLLGKIREGSRWLIWVMWSSLEQSLWWPRGLGAVISPAWMTDDTCG